MLNEYLILHFYAWQMTGVERIKLYGSIQNEGEEHTSHPLPREWPTEGAISFEHVTLKYLANHQPALRNISFFIHGHEKVIVPNVMPHNPDIDIF